MKKERKRPKSLRVISWRIIVLALALWLGAMGFQQGIMARVAPLY